MIMTPGLRKFALTMHVTSSVGWLGAVVAYLSLVYTALTSQDAQTVRAVWLAMELTGWYAIVPLAFTSLVTGILTSLGTPRGLFRRGGDGCAGPTPARRGRGAGFARDHGAFRVQAPGHDSLWAA
ncbi:MAG TPA: hypothetical protein VD969_26885 [Symbiobacteriaceae bacterium]|nr:hypothetical protein [Symbiobacteriaceae bacterium]